MKQIACSFALVAILFGVNIQAMDTSDEINFSHESILRALFMDKATQESLLCWAISDGDINKVKTFLASGEDVNQKNWFYGTPLSVAVHKRNKDLITILLDNNADINQADKYGETLLHEVAGEYDTKMAKILLARGANPNQVNDYGQSPLYSAFFGCHSGIIYNSDNSKIIKLLLRYDADVNLVDVHDSTLLQYAVHHFKYCDDPNHPFDKKSCENFNKAFFTGLWKQHQKIILNLYNDTQSRFYHFPQRLVPLVVSYTFGYNKMPKPEEGRYLNDNWEICVRNKRFYKK